MSQWHHTPAKLNLFLEILGRREDGFHELETAMIAISLFDSIRLKSSHDGLIGLQVRAAYHDQHLDSANEVATRALEQGGIRGLAEWKAQNKTFQHKTFQQSETQDDQVQSSNELERTAALLQYPGREARPSRNSTADLQNGGQAVRRDELAVPVGEDNLVVRAVSALRQSCVDDSSLSESQCDSALETELGSKRHLAARLGAQIELIKRIPSQAGLGGASSDAAISLLLANQAWGVNGTVERLSEIAAGLGSDVPFFLQGGAAVCRGRGEQIEPVQSRFDYPFVLVKPPIGLATPDVYRHCSVAERPVSVEPLLEALRENDPERLGVSLHNRLTVAARRLTPWIDWMADVFGNNPVNRRRISRAGIGRGDCLGHAMSGSGSSYFGVFTDDTAAQRFADWMRSNWDKGPGSEQDSSSLGTTEHGRVFVVRSLQSMPFQP